MPLTAAEVQKYYIGFYGRPADPVGLAYWMTQDAAAALTGFGNSPEYAALYAGMSVQQRVAQVYTNVLGRTADTAGLLYWSGEMTAGRVTVGNLVATMMANALNEDVTTIANRVTYSTAFTAEIAKSTANIVGYNGDAAAAAARTAMSSVVAASVGDTASLTTAIAALTTTVATVTAVAAVGQTFTLTAGLDTQSGTSGNDTFNAATATALGALDSIDGGAGIDTLNIFGVDSSGGAAAIDIPTTATVKNIEIANLTGAGAVTVNASGWTGLTNLNVKQAVGAANITAAATTDVSTAGTSDTIAINGGKNITVSDATNNKNIDIGATTGSAGTVTVTDTKQGAGTIKIDGGTDVTVTSSSQTTATTGVITIGAATKPTGEVNVTSNLSNAAAAATNMAGGVVTVNGGTSVNVTQTAAQAVMTTATTNSTTTQSKVVVNGGAATTGVTVNQTAAVAAADTVLAVAAVTEVNTVVFAALTAGQTAILNGLTFTAGAAGTTAAQTAAAFANLASGTTQGNSTLGTYQGVFTAGWTGAAVSGASNNTVVFTATTVGPKVDLVAGGTGTNPVVTETTAGVAAVTAAGKGGIANGVVEITDAGYASATADTITTATVNGYAASSFVKSDALTSLNLANSAGTFAAYNNTATTLALGVDNVQHAVSIDAGAAKYATLNVNTSGTNSAFALTAAAVKTLTVAGNKALDLSGSTLTVLETVTVSGAAGLTANASGATVTAVNTSASTGTNTISIDGSKATYTGGAGVDNVTLTATTVSKAISLGDGNDKVTLANGTTAVTGSISGGAGTDTLVMRAQDAATADDSDAFATKVTGFEILSLTAGGTYAIDLATLGNYTKVESSAATAITLNKMASGGTFTITGNSTAYTVGVTDADTGTADVLNLGLKSAGALTAGTVTVADVETINITSTDTDTTAHANTLTLTADKAATVTVSGNAALTLTLTGSAKVSSLDASAMTAGLTVTSVSTQAVTVTGGAGNDTLTAASGSVAHTLIGGAGTDTLTSNAGLSVLTGGVGADVFVVQSAGANVNIYTTITDFSAGDRLVLAQKGVETFNATKLTLGDTAVFQDYANLAAAGNGSVNGVISWFQFGGNTYVVQDLSVEVSFDNTTDIIVKLTGLVDLSTASLNIGGTNGFADAAVLIF
jgi:S-layer protein